MPTRPEMVNVFLHAPQDFRNLCVLARTLEVFGHVECYVFDPRRLIRDRYGKSRSRELRVVSAGAFGKIRWQRVEEPERFLADYAGRVVATVAEPSATALTKFEFTPTDLLMFGSESHGLPATIVNAAVAKLTIASRGQTQSLNLAVSLAIVVFEAQRQLASG
jgi:tRNA(Leu) C34 or U34 (ribose-2'-O)-methylase TrmL